MSRTRIALALLLALLPVLARAQVVPLPRDAHLERMGENAYFNGIPVQIERVTAPISQQSMVDHYREALGDRVRVVEHGKDVFVSHLDENGMITVRVVAQGPIASEALVMKSTPPTGNPPNLTFGLLLPAGSRMLTSMQSTDHGVTAKTLAFANDNTVNAIEAHLVRQFAERGMQRAIAPARAAVPNAARVIYFRGPAGDAFATITESGAERVTIINLTDGQLR